MHVAAGRIGDNELLFEAKRCFFLFQHGPHMVQASGIQVRFAADQFGELIALAGEYDENEIGGQHGDERGNNAVADLALIIVSPRRGKR